MTTKQAFISAYRAEVAKRDWAIQDPAKLEKFMLAVETTLTSPAMVWAWDGPASQQAWRDIGCKGRMTLRGLRALPNAAAVTA